MHQRKIRDGVLAVTMVFISSFLMNYVWESLHAVYLYEGHNFPAEKYIKMLLYVSAVDGLIISSVYLSVSALWMNILWVREMNLKQAFMVFLAGVVIAVVIEYRKVLILKEWSYTPFMPTISGIGISPLLQLSVTGLLTCWLTRMILAGKKDLKERKIKK